MENEAIAPNNAAFTLAELLTATQAELVQQDASVTNGVTSVSTDTRTLEPGALFVALHGPHYDGHAYLNAAYQKGAVAFLVSAHTEPPAGSVLRVPDTLEALGKLASYHRQRWAKTSGFADSKLIAVGGSAGKTTTRRAIAAVLSEFCPAQVHSTHANHNNRIGVPMTLLGLDATHRFAVVELGTSERGEIETLTHITAPDVAVLTRIGAEHTAGIGTLDDVEQEEGDLLVGVAKTGAVIVNADDERIARQLSRVGTRTHLRYGAAETATLRLRAVRSVGLQGNALELVRPSQPGTQSVHVRTPLLGEAGVYASLAAWAVAEHCLKTQLDPERFCNALQKMKTHAHDGRLCYSELADGTIVIDDTYNANPVSMKASIQFASELALSMQRRLLLVLGDMRELGPLAVDEHITLGRCVAVSGAEVLVAIGEYAATVCEAAARPGLVSHVAKDSNKAAPIVEKEMQKGDVILVKGSRGIQAEHVVKHLTRKLDSTLRELQEP